MNLGLEGKVALVTGASKGIGKAVAAFLASEAASFVNGTNYRVDGGSVASIG